MVADPTNVNVSDFPRDWQAYTLGSLFSFQNGVNAEKTMYGSGQAFVNVLEVINRNRLTLADIPGRIALPVQQANLYKVVRGNVLFNRTSETPEEVGLSSVYLGDEPVLFGGFVINGRPIGCDLDSIFASYMLRSRAVRKQIVPLGQGAIRSNIGQAALSKVIIFVPPLREQKAIAEALSDADAYIESLEQLLVKKRDIKQGVMQDLLTGEKRLPGFSGQWNKRLIGEVLTVAHGRSQKAVEDVNGAFPILATGGLIGHANTFLYDKPSVLIGRKGTIDRPQFMDTPFWTVDTLFYTKIREQNDAKFLYYRFLLVDWYSHNEASGVPSLNARTIEQIEIDVPSASEQVAISTILSDIDAEIVQLELKRDKATAVKLGMMQELLTGRTRLV